LTNQPK